MPKSKLSARLVAAARPMSTRTTTPVQTRRTRHDFGPLLPTGPVLRRSCFNSSTQTGGLLTRLNPNSFEVELHRAREWDHADQFPIARAKRVQLVLRERPVGFDVLGDHLVFPSLLLVDEHHRRLHLRTLRRFWLWCVRQRMLRELVQPHLHEAIYSACRASDASGSTMRTRRWSSVSVRPLGLTQTGSWRKGSKPTRYRASSRASILRASTATDFARSAVSVQQVTAETLRNQADFCMVSVWHDSSRRRFAWTKKMSAP